MHPDHYFPNAAPKGYHMIDNSHRKMKGDICWYMSDNKWHPIDKSDIGHNAHYYRVARPNTNTVEGITKRLRIKWQPLKTFPKTKAQNGKMVIFKTSDEIVRGCGHPEWDVFGRDTKNRWEWYCRESKDAASHGLIYGVTAWAPYQDIS